MPSCFCPLSSAPSHALALDFPPCTYGQLSSQAAQGAAALKAMGCKAGDSIAFYATPRPQTLALLFAAWRLSLSTALIPPKWPASSVIPFLNELAPALFVEDPSSLFHSPSLYKENILRLSLPSLFLLTSGSSGKPKWACFTLRQLFESADSVSAALQASPQDRWLLSLPLHHVGGLGVALRSIRTQGTLVFENRSLPLGERIAQAGARFASLVPTQLYRLLQDPPPPSLPYFLIGGAPLVQALYQKALARGLALALTYGLTEMSSTVLLCTKPKWERSFPFLGFPLPGREIALSPEKEILVRGSSLFRGYFPLLSGLPSRSDSFFPTGDLGCFHELHGWSIQGRKDFQFLSGGENIQPEEIESALLSHAQIEQAIVVPQIDEEFGALPFAFVRTSLSSEEILFFLSNLLPRYKIPAAFAPFPEENDLKPNRKQLFLFANKKLENNSQHIENKRNL